MVSAGKGSVSHGIDDVVDGDTVTQGSVLLRIPRVVGMLPRIAKVHVVADGNHHSPLIIHDGTPSRGHTIFLEGLPAVEGGRSGNLKSLLQIVQNMKNLVLVLQLNNWPVRKDADHAGKEAFPFLGSV